MDCLQLAEMDPVYKDLADNTLGKRVKFDALYEVLVKMQRDEVNLMKREENLLIPSDIDYFR